MGAQEQTEGKEKVPPAPTTLRAEEDYSYLMEESDARDQQSFEEAIKYIPFNESGNLVCEIRWPVSNPVGALYK